MAKTPAIPPAVKSAACDAVVQFNAKNKTRYEIHFRGKYAYLSRIDDRRNENSAFVFVARAMGIPLQEHPYAANMKTIIGRLDWDEEKRYWGFTHYLYSKERYANMNSMEEAMYSRPGSEHLDGTITGAMKAGLVMYP